MIISTVCGVDAKVRITSYWIERNFLATLASTDPAVIFKKQTCGIQAYNRMTTKVRLGYTEDKQFCLSAKFLKYACKELVLEAVKHNGGALRFAAKCMQDDKEVVSAAVAENVFAFVYASDRLRDDADVIMLVVTN